MRGPVIAAQMNPSTVNFMAKVEAECDRYLELEFIPGSTFFRREMTIPVANCDVGYISYPKMFAALIALYTTGDESWAQAVFTLFSTENQTCVIEVFLSTETAETKE
ncbi:TPA: hypothetical protein DF272_01290 [Candidatus Falkowbacteria bacterium]|nr:hypothetical protein [Candidatus Falkowbacteria bacterium]